MCFCHPVRSQPYLAAKYNDDELLAQVEEQINNPTESDKIYVSMKGHQFQIMIRMEYKNSSKITNVARLVTTSPQHFLVRRIVTIAEDSDIAIGVQKESTTYFADVLLHYLERQKTVKQNLEDAEDDESDVEDTVNEIYL